MTEYEREWTSRRRVPPGSRVRTALTKYRGHPTRFHVQLEYSHEGKWLQVARFDHDASGPVYRDVERSGLHLDVYHPDGSQLAKLTRWPPLPANEAMGVADDYLRERANELIRRFQSWL